MFDHSLYCLLPFIPVWDVEDQQIILRWSLSSRMAVMMGEFKMISKAVVTEHNPVKALMVFEGCDDVEAEPIPVKPDDLIEIVGRACNA